MRKFNVKVNGKQYYVEVEETSSEAVQPIMPVPVKEQASAPAPAPAVTAGGTIVTSPMPGQILDLAVQNGASVKKGDKIIVLEAMKMENEIVATASGTVTFLVKKGDSVDTGAKLASIQ